MDLMLTREQRERFRKYAEQHGIPIEEAVQQAAVAELRSRYRLPQKAGLVVPFKSLKRTGGKADE
ncbi:hypothetical protein [Stenotrophomonas indicatrix]|uniref:hypothetical protein n=1 Tax=Stenotrophomonas indicatrix TaxID=2045451 RepID=UPI0008C1DD55|nr:hypothetical protein [Stenotrophomonas indicatrix]SET91842.1 hypothetical protein SAMN05720615_109242 [Stenotrophomonas indicatrix]SEU12391.1 hypothetical protein SAMN05720615_1186 [Stenotrophomonas indicatrix]